MRHPLTAWAAAPLLAGLSLVSADAFAICTFGGPGNEQTLQGVFNSLLGSSAPNAVTSCVNDGTDAAWVTDGPAAATIVIELAGFANQNRFGIYDPLNPTDTSRQLQIFGGSAGAGASASITFSGNTVTIGWPGTSNTRTATYGSSVFGFYLRSPENGGTFYFSDTSRNPDGVDHMYAYQGNGSTFIGGPPGINGQVFATNGVLLAWEDLQTGGDLDYQDFVVYARSVTVVPLPAAAWLLGSALLMLPFFGRRKARS